MGSHGGPGSSSGKTPAASNSSNPEASKKKSFLAVARSGLIGGSNHSTTAEVKPSGNASKEPSNKKQQGADGMSKKGGGVKSGGHHRVYFCEGRPDFFGVSINWIPRTLKEVFLKLSAKKSGRLLTIEANAEKSTIRLSSTKQTCHSGLACVNFVFQIHTTRKVFWPLKFIVHIVFK